MDSLPVAPSSLPVRLSGLPAWVRPNGRDVTEADAAFAAGIALKSLDDLVRLDPVWAGCWRSRQALKCAAAAVRLMGRNEDEHALRDAVLLTAPAMILGPPETCFGHAEGVWPNRLGHHALYQGACGADGSEMG
jgi:hypothetical protein